MKSAIKDLKPSATSKRTQAKKASTNKKCDPVDLYDEFESKYHKTCERMEHKVYNVDTDNIDPDKNVAVYKKMLDLAHELEDFCNSHGQDSVEYF